MRVLFISTHCEGLGVAQKVVQEGHQVRFYCANPAFRLAGNNIIERVESFRPSIGWADLVIADMVGFGKYAELFKDHGKKVLSCSLVADLAELNRSKGMELFEKAGINVPQYWYFNSPDDYRIDNEAPKSDIVIKPCGNLETDYTCMSRNKNTTDYILHCLNKDRDFIIQEIVEGIEISTEGWWNGRNWVTPFNHTIEQNRFLHGGLGFHAGCMGNVVWATKEDELVRQTLLKLTDYLKRSDYVGPVDINCIVNENGIYALEPTFRMGYDAIEALMEGLREPVTDMLFEVAAGTKKEMSLSDDMMMAIRLSVPPWPLSDENRMMGKPVIGINEQNIKHIYFADVYKDTAGLYRWAGSDGVLLKVTARGRTINEARRRVYRTVNNLDILHVQYRQDIGIGINKQIEQLRQWGMIL